MLRLIALLLLCTSQTILKVSGSGNVHSRASDALFILKPVDSDDETPTGVDGLDLSGNAKKKDVSGKETSKLVQGTQDVQSPRKKSVFAFKKIEKDGRGTPTEQLFAKYSPVEQVGTPKTSNIEFAKNFDRKPLAMCEETEEELEVIGNGDSDEDDWSVDVNEILLENETLRNDQLNSLFEDLSISQNAQINRESRLVEEVLVEDVSSSESESESDYYVKSADGKKYIRIRTGVSTKAAKLKTDDSFEGLMEFVDANLVGKEEPLVANVPPAIKIKDVNVMDYTKIETIAKLGIADRMSLVAALHDQIRNSEDFESEIKLQDLPSAVFLFKISLIVRSRRNTLLTLEEMKSDRKLLKAIKKSGMGLLDLIEVAEYLMRADRDEISDEIISEKIIPHVVELHRRRNVEAEEKAEKQKKENNELSVFMSMLTTYGRVLVLNDLLNDRFVGRILREKLGAHEIDYMLEALIRNGCLTDEEVYSSARLLLKGTDSKEFNARKGAYLLKVCKKYGRKGKLIKALSA